MGEPWKSLASCWTSGLQRRAFAPALPQTPRNIDLITGAERRNPRSNPKPTFFGLHPTFRQNLSTVKKSGLTCWRLNPDPLLCSRKVLKQGGETFRLKLVGYPKPIYFWGGTASLCLGVRKMGHQQQIILRARQTQPLSGAP